MTKSMGGDAFLSYRHTTGSRLKEASNWLYKYGRFSNVDYVSPDDERLALKNEILMPFEYFELALAIWDAMEEYDTFAYLDSRDYWESVWTNLEVAGWRFLSSPPTAVRVTVGRNGGYSADKVSLPAMSRAEMNSWTEIRRNLRPYALQTASRDSIYRGGKLSRKRYLLPCLACRQYSLIRKRTIEDAAKSNDIVNCARCGTSYRIASEGKYSKIRSRTPIVAKPLSRSSNDEPRALTVEELIHLYTRENPPQGITDAGD